MKHLRGIATSHRIAIGKVYKITIPKFTVKKTKITNSNQEIKRFTRALQDSLCDLEVIKRNVLHNLGQQNASIFASHIKIMTNNDFIGAVKRQIQYDHLNSSWALDTIAKNKINTFLNNQKHLVNNHIMAKNIRLKINFMHDVTNRILSHLAGHPLPNLALINKPSIIVAHDLMPSDLAQLNTKYIKGAVADLGGKTAHSVIMARTLRIPTMVGMKNITSHVQNGDTLIINGKTGTVTINPSPAAIKQVKGEIKEYESHLKHLKHFKKRPTVSQDGFPMQIAANINDLRDLHPAINSGAEGVGLYRTEFLFMNASHLPSEEAQFKAYRKVVLNMDGKPVTFRTIDIGGDKRLPYLKPLQEHNPFLGSRGIRFCLTHPKIFRTQLRALLRAAAYAENDNVTIIFPLITTLREFIDAKAICLEEQHSLKKRGIKTGNVKIGMMIETPTAAILADKFAKVADSVSIGTNDLVQFMMAADRGNSLVANLYLPFDPSILRMIQHIVLCCHHEQIKVSVCGEMAASSTAIPLFLGMGINELSMNSMSILKARSLVKRLNAKKMRTLLHRILKQADNEIEVVRTIHQNVLTKIEPKE